MKKIFYFLMSLIGVLFVTSASANRIVTNPVLSQPNPTLTKAESSYPTNIFIFNNSGSCFYTYVPALGFDTRVTDQPLCPGYYQQIIGDDDDDDDQKLVKLYHSKYDKNSLFYSKYVDSQAVLTVTGYKKQLKATIN